MSEASTPRIRRGPAPDCVLTPRNYREKALPALRRDFQDRCAYSMQHLRFAGVLTCMEVDHFDPNKKNDAVQDYKNLFLASRHCNRSKDTFWPTDEEAAEGMRLLNPCEEMDYGVHIFEDSATGELKGETPPGRTQIEICDLNAPHLVEERKLRADIRARVATVNAMLTASEGGMLRKLLAKIAKLLFRLAGKGSDRSVLDEMLAKAAEAEAFMIPSIPAPPSSR